jgi:hypothetical protein
MVKSSRIGVNNPASQLAMLAIETRGRKDQVEKIISNTQEAVMWPKGQFFY